MTTGITLKEIIDARWNDIPVELQQVFHDASYTTHIDTIAGYYHLTEKQRQLLKNEIDLIIFLFEPLSQLSENLTKNLVIERSVADQIVSEIKMGILFGHTDTLTAIEQSPDFVSFRTATQTASQTIVPEANKNTREELELRPEGVSAQPETASPDKIHAKPLTRDEVIKALAPKRTMAGDIASIQEKENHNVGYDLKKTT